MCRISDSQLGVAYITVCCADEEQSGLVTFTMRVKSVSGNIGMKMHIYLITNIEPPGVLYLFRLQP